MKNLLPVILMVTSGFSYADEQQTEQVITQDTETESQPETRGNSYISRGNYIQNPYIGMPSRGDTQNVSESELTRDNVAQKWFADGTWNVFGAASYVDQNGYNNYGYAVNIFGQTGQVAGFSFGGLLTIANPFFSSQWNPADPENQAQGLSIMKQVTPQELFAEYQYSDIIQADVGWIGISNSPWMTYYQNNALNMVTYQGALVNVNPGGGWLLTGFAINGAQLLGEEGFSQQTMYNSGFDNGTATGNIGDAGSSSTVAAGASWSTPGQMLNLRLWGYAFADYANMAYADTTIKLPINDELGFTLGFQGAMQCQNGDGNILNNNGYGNSVSSNMIGAQLGFNYSIFGIQFGYNNIWGPTDGYEAGGLVSPYTYQYATDPLYTTGWIQGMVERSSGQAYKIAPSLSLLDNSLIISPSYQYYATTIIPASNEYDIQLSYSLPQVKGLTFFGAYGYVTDADPDGNGVYQAQLMVSYLY
ncbi:MAG: hypothetical protein EKK54_10395 [Neisseriaceae bacterium]|nr:MAG: hypothetical protein EKK54_10395 [Neisseriaceae bacterium]